MKIAEPYFDREHARGLLEPLSTPSSVRPNLLRLLSCSEVSDLRTSLVRGQTPRDLATKLAGMDRDDLTARYIEQHCRLFIALLAATNDGSFTQASAADRERLLRVLAYVRKDDDQIPDYLQGGYTDDQQEVKEAVRELFPILQAFKAWRLRHQVPALWARTSPADCRNTYSNAA